MTLWREQHSQGSSQIFPGHNFLGHCFSISSMAWWMASLASSPALCPRHSLHQSVNAPVSNSSPTLANLCGPSFGLSNVHRYILSLSTVYGKSSSTSPQTSLSPSSPMNRMVIHKKAVGKLKPKGSWWFKRSWIIPHYCPSYENHQVRKCRQNDVLSEKNLLLLLPWQLQQEDPSIPLGCTPWRWNGNIPTPSHYPDLHPTKSSFHQVSDVSEDTHSAR